MAEPALLTDAEIEALLAAHPGWSRQSGRLERNFEFTDFSEAFGFITRIALLAERQFHHPEWTNVYGTVTVTIVDHELGGISSRDRTFVERVDAIAG